MGNRISHAFVIKKRGCFKDFFKLIGFNYIISIRALKEAFNQHQNRFSDFNNEAFSVFTSDILIVL